jgi:hypothetical protein
MFRALRPKPPEPLPLPFRNRRAEREAERRKAVERFANVEMGRVRDFSWNQPGPGLVERLSARLSEKLVFLVLALLMGALIVGAFLWLSRVGLMKPGPTIIYVEDWSGRPDLSKPVAPPPTAGGDDAARAAALAREQAAARGATPGPAEGEATGNR